MAIGIIRNDSIDPEELNLLLETNGWDVNPVDKLVKCLNTSWCNVCARDEERKLIGYVRVLSDGLRHAYICSLIVHPNYRRKGIGTQIMEELMTMLREDGLYPTLVAGPDKKHYYEGFGFEVESDGYTAMCIRKPY